jgi:hypothetical protein
VHVVAGNRQAGFGAVPIARYFILVGGTLAALLFIAGWCLPTPPVMFAGQRLAIDRAVIRIKSTHKWPEKVVLDTSKPTIAPSAVDEPPATHSLTSDEAGNQSDLEAMVQLQPHKRLAAVDHPILQTKVARAARSKRVARGPVTRRLARVGAASVCCQFGWLDNRQTIANAMARANVMPSWSMNWN